MRRLRRVDPSNAGKILGHERYWTRQFIESYLERCEDLVWVDPQAAHDLVRFTPMVITRLATVGSRPTDIPTEPDRQALHLWSLGLLAASHQQIGHTIEAQHILDEAHKTLHQRLVAPLGEAALRYYEARSWPQRPAALPNIERALEIYLELDESNAAARALIVLGIVQRQHRVNSGALAWTRALELADGRTARGRQIFQEALDLLLDAAKNDLFLTDQEEAVVRLGKLTRRQRRNRRSEVYPYLQWIVGQMYLNLGIGAYGRQWLTRARAGFESLGRPENYLEVTLTMAASMQASSEQPELAPLASETRHQLVALGRTDLTYLIDPWLRNPVSLDAVEQLRKRRVWVVSTKPISIESLLDEDKRQDVLQALLPSLMQRLADHGQHRSLQQALVDIIH